MNLSITKNQLNNIIGDTLIWTKEILKKKSSRQTHYPKWYKSFEFWLNVPDPKNPAGQAGARLHPYTGRVVFFLKAKNISKERVVSRSLYEQGRAWEWMNKWVNDDEKHIDLDLGQVGEEVKTSEKVRPALTQGRRKAQQDWAPPRTRGRRWSSVHLSKGASIMSWAWT